MENFIETLNWLSTKLLPFFGAIAMVLAIILIHHLIKCVQNATKMLDEAYIQLRKLDKPLGTAESICQSIDYMHDLSKESVKGIVEFLFKNGTKIKQWLEKIFSKPNDSEN